MAERAVVSRSDPGEEIITVRVAAQEKGVHPVSIYRAIREGRLKGTRSGNTILIRRRDLAEWVPTGRRPRSRAATAETASPPSEAGEESTDRRIQRKKNQAAIALLRQWREEGDSEEQRAAYEALKEVLNEERKGYRLIYP